MELQICRYCKYWRKIVDDTSGNITGECINININHPIIHDNRCNSKPWTENKRPIFICGPKFGCIHFKVIIEGFRPVMMAFNKETYDYLYRQWKNEKISKMLFAHLIGVNVAEIDWIVKHTTKITGGIQDRYEYKETINKEKK